MPSRDSAPYNGDDKLLGKESRAYFLFAWREIRANREPAGVEQAQPDLQLKPDDSRSPYRVYADTLMTRYIRQLADPIRVLDMGCGKGVYAGFFAGHQGEYHGVDAFKYPEWAQVATSQGELKIQFHHSRGEQVGELPIRANFTLSSSSLEHVDDPDAVVRGLAARSEQGAFGLHIVPAPWSLMTYGKHGWRRFSAERLKDLFEAAGFETLQIYRLGGLPSQVFHFFWISIFEEGLGVQNITLSALPFFFYRALSVFRYSGMRTNPILAPLYRVGLRLALRLDRFLPLGAVGYAIVVQRKVE